MRIYNKNLLPLRPLLGLRQLQIEIETNLLFSLS